MNFCYAKINSSSLRNCENSFFLLLFEFRTPPHISCQNAQSCEPSHGSARLEETTKVNCQYSWGKCHPRYSILWGLALSRSIDPPLAASEENTDNRYKWFPPYVFPRTLGILRYMRRESYLNKHGNYDHPEVLGRGSIVKIDPKLCHPMLGHSTIYARSMTWAGFHI